MPDLDIPAGYERAYTAFNDWRWFNRRLDVKDNGWKLHVSANASNAQSILDKVLPVLIEGNIAHKFLPTTGAVDSQREERAGKFLAIYPDNFDQALATVSRIDKVLVGIKRQDSPVVATGERVGNTVVYAQYGAYNGMVSPGPKPQPFEKYHSRIRTGQRPLQPMPSTSRCC